MSTLPTRLLAAVAAALAASVLVVEPALSQEVTPGQPEVADAGELPSSPALDAEGAVASPETITPIVADPALQVGDFRAVVPFVFPTTGEAKFSYGYDDPRDGGRRVHKAVDLFVPRHAPLFATVAGTVCRLQSDDGGTAGRHLSVCGEDGRRYLYLHMDNDTEGTDDGAAPPERAFADGIVEGAAVRAGQLLGWSGDSGNAEGTPPHLHFEIRDPNVMDYYGDARLDPYPSLVDALTAGRVLDGSSSVPTTAAAVDPVIVGPPRAPTTATAATADAPPAPLPRAQLTGARDPVQQAGSSFLPASVLLCGAVLAVGYVIRRRVRTALGQTTDTR